MGCFGGKPSKRLTKTQVEIICIKIKEYLTLQKDRKSNEAVKQQKLLLNLISANIRNKQEQYICMQKIVNILKFLTASRFLISYCEILKSNAQQISDSRGDISKIHQLIPFIQGIVYSAKYINLSCVDQFNFLISDMYGQNFKQFIKAANIQKQLKQCFQKVMPTQLQINIYALEMCSRNEISLQRLNAIGHNFSQNVKKEPVIQPCYGPGQQSGSSQNPPNNFDYKKSNFPKDNHNSPYDKFNPDNYAKIYHPQNPYNSIQTDPKVLPKTNYPQQSRFYDPYDPPK